jgi:uncharacterized repeat protein (TIGR01451 family)
MNRSRTSQCLSLSLILGALATPATGQLRVGDEQKVSATQGGFGGMLDDSDLFGASAAALGDLDGDGVGDLAVGASQDDDGDFEAGAVWVLFLNPDGTVKGHQKISSTQGGFAGNLDFDDRFGAGVTSLGDLDGDGVVDLAVGAPHDDDGSPGSDTDRGSVWVLFLNSNGTVRDHRKISDTQGGFTGQLSDEDRFGSSVAGLGDLDGDGVADLAVGAPHDDDGGAGVVADRGAIWVLLLNPDGSVKAHQKISMLAGGFTGALDDNDRFGHSVATLGSLDGDTTPDLAVGARFDDDGGTDRGAVWVLFLNADARVREHRKVSDVEGGFTGELADDDRFGTSVTGPGDLDGDGLSDLVVGEPGDDDGGDFGEQGAAWLLFLESDGSVRSGQKISAAQGGFGGSLFVGDELGTSVASLGDLDGDGVADIAAGAFGDNDGGFNRGAAWVLFLADATAEADLAVSVTVDDRTPEIGQQVVFQVALDNLGPANATGIIVGDRLPPGLSFAGAMPSQGTYNPVSGIWNVGALAAGSAATLAVTATPVQAGLLRNVARVRLAHPTDPNAGNDASQVLIRVAPAADDRN